jgi:NAD(P)H-binding
MPRAGIRRVVVESVAFLFRDAIIPPAYLLGRLFFPGVVADASAMEMVLKKSGLDWTIARPPKLTPKPYTGNIAARGHLPPFSFSISYADVADFMIKAVQNHALIDKVVGVCGWLEMRKRGSGSEPPARHAPLGLRTDVFSMI